MKKIAVTGGNGKVGKVLVQDLLDHGFTVTNLDLARSPDVKCQTKQVDLADFGQTIDALAGQDSVIHLAAICQARVVPPAETFRINTMSTFNVFHAAKVLGFKRVVWASSETTLGLAWSKQSPPKYLPIDEDHFPYPGDTYALSKHVGEVIAQQYARWTGDMTFAAMRFSNVMAPEDYKNFPTYWSDPLKRVWNLWSYIDARDAAQACRLALTAEIKGHEAFIITSPDTVMNRPTMDLIKEVFPQVPVKRELKEFATPLLNDKARKVLGYNPTYTWRDTIKG
ncbi:MAG TPA: NAD(P)-dependent oxidoreductase [Tepidisphaeraceae bacterium]|jgi:nucleoside-diphosphate-sugar epimerase